MITVPAGVKIYLACGVTDMRKGFDGLSVMAQDVLKQDPFSGAIFCFRGRRGDLMKIMPRGRHAFRACGTCFAISADVDAELWSLSRF